MEPSPIRRCLTGSLPKERREWHRLIDAFFGLFFTSLQIFTIVIVLGAADLFRRWTMKKTVTPLIGAVFAFLLLFPVSDTEVAVKKLSLYKVQCLVPFKSMCGRSRGQLDVTWVFIVPHSKRRCCLPVVEQKKLRFSISAKRFQSDRQTWDPSGPQVTKFRTEHKRNTP